MPDNKEEKGVTTNETILNFFSYFTILTNILVALSLTFSVFFPASRSGRYCLQPGTQTAIAVYISVAGIIYSIALRKIWHPEGLQVIADRILHDMIPVLYIFYRLIFTPRKILTWTAAFSWLIYPLAYLTYALLRGASTGWFAYYFPDFTTQRPLSVFIHIFVITGGFFITAQLLLFINRTGVRKSES